MKVEIYSDVVCPWCYIGEQRFSRALAALPGGDEIEVEFKPYQLDPSAPHEPRPIGEELKRKYGPRADAMMRHATQIAAGEGLDLRFDRALAVNTLAAHRLIRLAGEEHGPEVQRSVVQRLFHAHFTDGLNVGDVKVLADLAADAGMDRDRVANYLASDEGVDEVLRDIAYAQRLGIQAVPTFIFDGRQAVQGAQSTSTFLRVLEELLDEAGEADETEEASAACVDGSCDWAGSTDGQR